jgi:ABC-type spermidine/putrescine transport system permease subunit II
VLADAPESVVPARAPAPAHRPRRRLPAGRAGLWLITSITAAFLLLPVAVVVLYSFNSQQSLTAFGLPSLRWYSALAHNSALLASVRVSLEVAVLTTVVATVVGTLLAFGLTRSRTRWSRPTNGVLLLTLVTPEIATAMSLFLIYTTQLHVSLSVLTITASHITFSLVYVTVIVRTQLTGLRREFEEAARDLGCGELQTLRLVVLPQIRSAVIGAGLLVFVLSFDDFVTSYLTSGVGTPPLPVYIYSMIKFGISPEINAIGTLMIAVTAVLGITGVFLLGFRTRRGRAA